ncbi:extracellular solute-binding protein [Leadbettera azotonutricia]|uniref:sn-glycerol-3-phosphate-binding periplasmic protein UgpB n=1 Tax=Leadbettera azotonutricia (strain ATCC BAA-888 / DSM 13862 / ZAS-9) TaxID=545695 RepID=F5YF78_LEAAZ|nr:extracellular solute-binding protein [Leadbettera azotonutricia]AEF81567.1 putative glycerol-3-phosphate ABC transporter, periplasmic glycerol-3-phosphate-binding protein [Leadbettera azotonutricia ZAS-9]
MKKIGLCFLALLLLVLLSFACVKNNSPAVKALVPDQVKISFWHSMADDAGRAFESYVREFNQGPGAEKGILVESVFQGQYADATAKLRPLLQARQAEALPDVMQVDSTGVVDYLNSEFAYTVDDALKADSVYDHSRILEAPLKAWNYYGRQLGLPVSASTTVMYYNKTMLEAAGVSKPPTTFEEIIEVARKLPSLNANGQKLTAFAQVPNSPLLANWIGQIPGINSDSSYLVNMRNGRDGTADRLVCDTEGTLLAFLKAWKQLYDAGALLNVSDGLNNLFLTQQICFLTASTSNLAGLLSQISGRFELGCAYFPRLNEGAKFGAAVSGSALLIFNKKSSAKTAAAWEFVKYMTSAPVQARFAAATGYMPVNSASSDETIYSSYISENPQALVGANQLAETSPDMLSVTVGPSRDFYMEIMNQISSMLTSSKSPEAAVKSMSAALNLLLEDYAAANAD